MEIQHGMVGAVDRRRGAASRDPSFQSGQASAKYSVFDLSGRTVSNCSAGAYEVLHRVEPPASRDGFDGLAVVVYQY